MTIHYLGLGCHCDECSFDETFDNPKKYDSWTLQTKAILKGWYLPGNGKQRCPRCHLALAKVAGLPSMYATHPHHQAIERQLSKLKDLEAEPPKI